MIRLVIGAVVGGLVQFIIGAIAWASPLGKLAFKDAGEGVTSVVQTNLQPLSANGTGTYFVPSREIVSDVATTYEGPTALVFLNSQGFAPMNFGALFSGLLLSMLMLFLIGVALSQIDGFGARVRALVLIAAATVLYFIVAMPVYNFYMPWAWWLYLAVECFIAFVAGGYVMLRWFMPAAPAAVRESAPPPENRSDAPPAL